MIARGNNSKSPHSVVGLLLVVLAGLSPLACGGMEAGVDGPDDFEIQAQALGAMFARPVKNPSGPVAYADLVVEIRSCGYDSFTFAVRNQGTAPTEASSCSVFYCTDTFEIRAYEGNTGHSIWTEDLQPGEERVFELARSAGSEGLVRVVVDTWGSNPEHSVVESNENNNVAEAFCVM